MKIKQSIAAAVALAAATLTVTAVTAPESASAQQAERCHRPHYADMQLDWKHRAKKAERRNVRLQQRVEDLQAEVASLREAAAAAAN
jgi:hypothetical protein